MEVSVLRRHFKRSVAVFVRQQLHRSLYRYASLHYFGFVEEKTFQSIQTIAGLWDVG